MNNRFYNMYGEGFEAGNIVAYRKTSRIPLGKITEFEVMVFINGSYVDILVHHGDITNLRVPLDSVTVWRRKEPDPSMNYLSIVLSGGKG
jgi:hypothetical protein